MTTRFTLKIYCIIFIITIGGLMFSFQYLYKRSVSKGALAFLFIIFIAGCSEITTAKTATSVNPESQQKSLLPVLDVYKTPTCGCCQKWIDHIDDSGFQSIVHNRVDLTSLKMDMGIAPRYRSCHTAISTEGYIFEGHVPAKFIQQFLAEAPKNALGLSVPAMPVGTPGMEMGERFMPYQVLLLKPDGLSEVYAMVNSYKEQF